MAAPSMVNRVGDQLVVRSVVSGDALFGTTDQLPPGEPEVTLTPTPPPKPAPATHQDEDVDLPQCKIKRNYACSQCSYYTQNPRFYLYHLKNVHKEKIKVYECPSCLYASKHSQKLQRHVHMVHVMGAGRKKAPKPKPPPKPPKPPKMVPPPKLLPRIVPKEEDDCFISPPICTGEGENKMYKCTLCPFTSRSQTLVTRHERVVHLKKKFFRCIKCNYVTHMKARYTKHVKYHSMPMIKCDMCDFRTPYKWNLDRHNKNHMGDGAFKCSLCNFTADIKQSLTVHEMNHHVPPVGQAVPTKRRNRVGASDTLEDCSNIDHDEMEMLRLEREDDLQSQLPDLSSLRRLDELEVTPKPPLQSQTSQQQPFAPLQQSKNIMMKKPKTVAHFNAKELTVKLGEKVVNPGDVLQHKNGTVYVKKIKCRVCNYRAAWESEMVRHEMRVHGLEEKKKAPRPIPNLIPIQPSAGSTNAGTGSGPPVGPGGSGPNTGGNPTNKPPPPPILKIPNLIKGRSAPSTPEKAMSEKDLNDICAKSCPNSSLKDFASLIGDEEAFKNSHDSVPLPIGSKSAFPDKNGVNSPEHLLETKSLPDGFKKKNASFFDKLKEKLMTGAGESCNLICEWCGHQSKCLSESVRHKKLHSTKPAGSASPSSGNSVISGAELSSTRCQHCRQRCKTSADLVVHLKSCVEAMKKTEHADDDDEEEEEEEDKIMDVDETREEIKSEDGAEENIDGLKPPHPMENKVFVWTNMGRNDEQGLNDEDSRSKSPQSDECSVVGIETAPGIGAVTSKSKAASHGNLTGNILGQKLMKMKGDHSVKKVYKCPHCSFWASTASRFHVHIVGHLNKKPFECSLCAYRSNWRWDITKHIRLKTVRDSSHERARVLMTDETGRRNYSKYNKYLTLMKVHEPSAESSGSGRRTKPLTQSYGPVPILPAPPKLTPAPALHSTNPNTSLQMQSSTPPPPPPLSQHRPIYPKPPPLHSSFDLKRPMQGNPNEDIPKKKMNVENKKTMWKCKKCLFRDSDRSVVLAHVKQHYRSQCQGGSDAENRAGSRPGQNEELNDSNEHRRKQSGGQSWQDENSQNEQNDDGDNDTGGEFMCETCPFICDTQQAFDQHMEYHFERPEANLRCYACPYFVTDKSELKEHMTLHRDSDGEEGVNHNLNTSGQSVQNGDAFANKRYKCSICPYVSNSKSQFLYHKQFHRPRGAPFRCNLCSYNVTRRHLLHQHLRLHGINIPIQKTKDCGYEEFEEGGSEPPGDIPTIDTSNLPEIPLVWVSKLGNLTKMFKCRYCPHVNIRKSNIQEHEKMHSSRVKPNSDGTSPNPQQHHCPDCNYVCNNAGVLSSHAKVHQGLFGQVCSLVDLNRSDETQIKELNALLGREEEGPPEILPHEINKDFKDNTSPPPPPYPPSPSVKMEKDMDNPNSDGKVLHFCSTCPARFLYQKELEIHTRFHSLQLQYQCESCSYTARQQPHLLAHYKVHTDEYQDRTSSLCEVYPISAQHPKPKIAVIVDGSEEVGPAWVVVAPQRSGKEETEYDLDEGSGDLVQHGSRIVQKQFACNKCPATFFKSVALQYHTTLHGGSGPHKCRSCDYAVKTYGNLIKHEAVHGKLEPRAKVKVKTKRPVDYVPTSGTELFRHKTEAAQKVANTPPAPPPPPPPLHIDPEFGVLMHGSPEFIYPTYLKNGKLKEKRYKCHKCPSAFEKREQYKVHLSLHGSKQRYRCERCDYSVKYYANYIQHLRKHQHNDATKAERKMSSDKSVDESGNDDVSEHNDTASEEVITTPIVSRSAKKMQLSMADQQTIMLMQQRVVSNSVSTPEVLNRCPYCPYSNQRKDGVGSHVKCHSNAKGGAFMCKHCDYTVPQQHFLREHNKLHFSPLKGMRPEAYMKCDRLELWSEPVDQTGDTSKKVLIFKDKGNAVKSDRFLPEISVAVVNGDDETNEKTFINLKTGEMEVSDDSVENIEKDEDKENQEMKVVCKQEENNEDINGEENENASELPIKTESVTSESEDAEEPVVLNGDVHTENNEVEDECGSDDDKKDEKVNEEDNDQTSCLVTGSDSEDSSSDSSSSTDDSEQDSTSSSMTSTHQD